MQQLDILDTNRYRMYQRGLIFVLMAAVSDCLPGSILSAQYTVGESVICKIDYKRQINPFDIDTIKQLMTSLINLDLPFEQLNMSKDKAISLLSGAYRNESANLLRYSTAEKVTLYCFNGIYSYSADNMPPSSGILSHFDLLYDSDGVILVCPSRSGKLKYEQSPKLNYIFAQSKRWAKILECEYASDLNEMIENGRFNEFILINEALHDKELAMLSSHIISDHKRVALISGPSSSGKTTFTYRLNIELKTREKKPHIISMDNYYGDRTSFTPEQNKEYDYEHIDAINIARLNEDIENLLAGKTVKLPRFDFMTKKSHEHGGAELTLGKDDVLLIEGIHGLNEAIKVDDSDKFKIYISALTQLKLDKVNRIHTTDVRKIRRMVRDFTHRNTPVDRTLEMWNMVREGEKRWIFPYQEQATGMFNSTLVYEMPYLKNLAVPLLEKVEESSPNYEEAQRLIKLLSCFLCADDQSIIPNNSILREFIGGSCFET